MTGRFVILCCAAVFAAPSLSGAGDENAEALKPIQGVWTFESQVVDGQETPAEILKTVRITFVGDKFSVKQGDKVIQAGTHKLDPSKSPNEVDATVTEGQGKGTVMLGIYEIKGDAMKACLDPEGKKRPGEFKAPKGSGLFLNINKREKK